MTFFLVLPTLLPDPETCLIVALFAMGWLILQVCDLQADLKDARKERDAAQGKAQHWFDEHRGAQKQLDERAVEDAAEAKRFAEGWKKLEPEIVKIDRERTALDPHHRIGLTITTDTPRRALALLLSEIKS